MAGRDILSKTGIQNVLQPEVATPAIFNTLSEETAEPEEKSNLNNIGDDFDGFWKGIEDALASVSEVLASPIKGLRNSEAWKNDYFRILFTVGLFAFPVAPVLGVVAGVAVAAVIALAVAAVPGLPILGAGLIGGAAAGFFAFGAALLAGGAGLFFSILFGLAFLAGGITLIVLASGFGPPGAVAAIIFGVLFVILSPLFLLAVGSSIGIIVAGIVGFILLTGAGIAVMVVPAVVVGGIAGAIAGAIALVLAVPALGLVGAALPVVMIVVGFILCAALGSTRPANEKKAQDEDSTDLPENPDFDNLKKNDPKFPNINRVPAPQPAPQPRDEKKVKENANNTATRADFALAA